MPQIDVIKLCKYFEKSDIAKIEYSIDNEKIVLEKKSETVVTAPPMMPMMPMMQSCNTAPESVSAAKEEVGNNYAKVKSPIVGVFYTAPAPGEKPFVTVGDTVKKGQIMCLLEAMKMMSEVTAPVSGTVKNIMFKNEEVVGFEDVLFEVEEC